MGSEKTDRTESQEKNSETSAEKSSREAQDAMRKDNDSSKSESALAAAERTVKASFGDLHLFRSGVDADAGSIHDSIVPNPFQAGGMMSQRTRDELTLAGLKSHNPDELRAINESYRSQYGHDLLDDAKKYMTPDAYRRAQSLMNGESDPGYLSPTKQESESALNSMHDRNGKPLSDYIDAEQLAAIQRNEVVKRGNLDDLGIGKTDGPAQMSEDNIRSLRQDPRYAEQLRDADINTVEGSQKFIAAFSAREVDRFNENYYGKQAATGLDPNGKPIPEDRKAKYAQIQEQWNNAVASGDKETTRKLLADRYNGGNPTQVAEVEAQRSATPTSNHLRDTENDVADIWHWAMKKVGVA